MANSGKISILDSYVNEAPSAQAAVDIFKSEWSSMFPSMTEVDTKGHAALFEDPRLDWFISRLGPLQAANVLELGPLEGAHSYMLHNAGAGSVTAIEANTRAYLKCLITKEILGLDRVKFLLGDFVKALEQDDRAYNVALASGVIYHMKQPAQLISLLCSKCENIYVWTHYFDADHIARNSNLARMFSAPEVSEYNGFRHKLFRKAYGEALGWSGFSGGSAEYACWMSRDDVLACFEHFGMRVEAIQFEQKDHPNGPSFAFHARRTP